MSQFRLQAKNISLTYPQSNDLTKEIIRDFLQTTLGSNLSEWIIAEEKHQDGNLHFHVGLRTHDKLHIRDAAYFDCNGRHPNVQAAKNWKAWVKYCKKEGNYICSISAHDALDALSAKSPTSFYKLVKQTYPKDYLFRKQSLDYLATQLFENIAPTFEPEYGLDSFVNVPTELSSYLEGCIDGQASLPTYPTFPNLTSPIDRSHWSSVVLPGTVKQSTSEPNSVPHMFTATGSSPCPPSTLLSNPENGLWHTYSTTSPWMDLLSGNPGLDVNENLQSLINTEKK